MFGRSCLQFHTPTEHVRCHCATLASKGFIRGKCRETARPCRSKKSGGSEVLKPRGSSAVTESRQRVLSPPGPLCTCGDQNPGSRKLVRRREQPMACGSLAGDVPMDSGNSGTPERTATDRRWEPSRVLQSGPTTARGTCELNQKL